MGFIFAVDTSLSMLLTPDAQVTDDIERTRFGVAAQVICDLIEKAKKMVPPPTFSLYSYGRTTTWLSKDIELESGEKAKQLLFSKKDDVYGISCFATLLKTIYKNENPGHDDHIIIFTDGTVSNSQWNYYSQCETRFCIINKVKETIDQGLIEEFEELSAESCGHEMSAENETYYRLFYYSDEFGDENVTSAIFADMFVVPTYQIRFGNLTSWFAADPPLWQAEPFLLDIVGFIEPKHVVGIPTDACHHLVQRHSCDTFDDENECPDQEPGPAQVHLFQLLMEAMKVQPMISVCRFVGSGRYSTISLVNEDVAPGLIISLIPPLNTLPEYVPNLETLTFECLLNSTHQNMAKAIQQRLEILTQTYNNRMTTTKYQPLQEVQQREMEVAGHTIAMLQTPGAVRKGMDWQVAESDVPASYTQKDPQSWITSHGIQNDVQKILRYLKKLPDRTDQFYQEINRLRAYASIIDGTGVCHATASLILLEAQPLGEPVMKHARYVAEKLMEDLDQFKGDVPDIEPLP